MGENAQTCVCLDTQSCFVTTQSLWDGMYRQMIQNPRAVGFGNFLHFISCHYEIPTSPIQMTAKYATVFKEPFLINEEILLAVQIYAYFQDSKNKLIITLYIL